MDDKENSTDSTEPSDIVGDISEERRAALGRLSKLAYTAPVVATMLASRNGNADVPSGPPDPPGFP